MKHNFLKLALEEAGLVGPATEPTTASEKEVDDLLEEAKVEQAESDMLVDQLGNVMEVQAGLEALVSSMESALVDPNYSPREYQLQVNHAATLLGSVGLSLPAGYSCESTDGASDAKDSFADKAKKLGKVLIEYIKKIVEWFKGKFVSANERVKTIYASLKAKIKKAEDAGIKIEPVEVKVEDVKVPEGIETTDTKFRQYIDHVIELVKLIESKLEKSVDVKEEDMQAFVDEYLQEFNEAAKGLPGNPVFTVDGFEYDSYVVSVSFGHIGNNIDKLLKDNEAILTNYFQSTKGSYKTLETVEKRVSATTDVFSLKFKAVHGLCKTLFDVTRYGSTIGHTMTDLVSAMIKKSFDELGE